MNDYYKYEFDDRGLLTIPRTDFTIKRWRVTIPEHHDPASHALFDNLPDALAAYRQSIILLADYDPNGPGTSVSLLEDYGSPPYRTIDTYERGKFVTYSED